MTNNIESFAEEIKNCIEEKLRDEKEEYTVSLLEKTKNNDIKLHGIAIRPEGLNAVPLIYLENYYDSYLDGRSVEDISDGIISLSAELRKEAPAFRMPDLEHDSIKDRLRVRLVNTFTNTDTLQKMVRRDVGCGFTLTPYIDLPESSGINGIIQVTKDLAKAMGYDEMQLMETALDNTASMDPAYLKRISELVRGDDCEDLLTADARGEDSILVLGHESTEFGAVALFYPGMRQRISEIVGGDYYVLPSSIHEILIVPDNGDYSSTQLMQMVMAVNKNELMPQDKLADKVLLYRSDLALLTVAEDMERDSMLDIAR